jgi:hypothetical protein
MLKISMETLEEAVVDLETVRGHVGYSKSRVFLNALKQIKNVVEVEKERRQIMRERGAECQRNIRAREALRRQEERRDAKV